MTRLCAVLSAIAFLGGLVGSLGAALFDPWLMAVGFIGAALAAMVWGYYHHDPLERWRWNGERHDEPGYTGEVSHDGGQTWEDEHDDRAVWPSDLGGVE